MLTARVRNWGFHANDLLKGSPIRKHCEDIDALLASGAESPERLEAILRHAVQTTPFYADCRGYGSLRDFPITSKATVKAQPDRFLSECFRNTRLHVMHTSGSTGNPLSIYQDWDKRHRVLAEMICFGRRAGYHVGDRYVFTRVWNEHNRKSWLGALRENAIMFDISLLDENRMSALGDLLRNDHRIGCLIGYPSTLEALARHLEARGDKPESFHLRTIITISERLPEEVRAALRARLGCPVVARYSNQENGVFAQQCPEGDEFHLNTASFVFEFLKLDEDKPARPDEEARMVVTDLFNRAMPLIRYDTGDVVLRQSFPTCGWETQTLGDIRGRREDLIYDTRDRLVSPATVSIHLWGFTQLKQFQFIQEGQGTYQLVVNGAKGHYRDEEFVEKARIFLGEDARVAVVHMDPIPSLPSGKYALIISRYKPSA